METLNNKLLTQRQKILISLACLPTNLGWALSESLIIPYLLIIGAPLYICSWSWLLSPLLSAYLAPKLDDFSDAWQTTNCWGWKGRKQCIFWLSLIACLCMMLLPCSHFIAARLFHTESVALTFIIAMVTFTVMDISFYLLLRPLQALIWDLSSADHDCYMDVMKVLNVMQGICRMSGLIIVAICVSFDFALFGTHIASAFILGALLTLIVTFFALFYSPNAPTQETTSLESVPQTIPYANNGYSSNFFTDCTAAEEARQMYHSESSNSALNTSEISRLLLDNIGTYKSADHIDEYASEDEDMAGVDRSNGDSEHRWSYRAMYVLWVSQLCGWCSMCSVVLFWTSFIAIDIYHGIRIDERRNHLHRENNSYEWLQFKAGLVFGCYGLLITALIAVNCSVLYPWLRRKLSTRTLYLSGEFMMALLCILFYSTVNATWLLILISLFGFVMQIHMQSTHELTQNEMQPIFEKMRRGDHKRYIEYVMELANVIAPVIVSLFGGPMVYAFDGEFKYLFLLTGVLQLVADMVVLLMFCNVLPLKLPRADS